MEEWRDVVGYEGLYQVSNLGNVKSLNYKRSKTEKILKLEINARGYCSVNLHIGGIMRRKKVHRLVAQAFIPNPDNKKEIDHIDTNPTNNHINNLCWATHAENRNNPLTKIKYMGENNNRSIPTMQYSKQNEFIAEFVGIKEASRITEIHHSSIIKACKGKVQTAGGFIWKYKNENNISI